MIGIELLQHQPSNTDSVKFVNDNIQGSYFRGIL